MGFDDMGLAAGTGGFDHVRIDSTLGQPAHIMETASLLLEHLNEQAAYDLALLFRVADAGQGLQEARFRIHPQYAHAHMPREGIHHLIAFLQPEQPGVHEYAGQLGTDRAMQQRRYHR
jgi:hypothetical protein